MSEKEKEMTSRISPEERAHWRQMIIGKHALPEGWIENILDKKPKSIVTQNGGEYLALCDLDEVGDILIHSTTCAAGEKHGTYILTLSYPDPEARVQTSLFDL